MKRRTSTSLELHLLQSNRFWYDNVEKHKPSPVLHERWLIPNRKELGALKVASCECLFRSNALELSGSLVAGNCQRYADRRVV